jgi:hypothetical protein
VLMKLPFSGYTKLGAQQKVAFNRAVAKEFGEDADKLTPELLAKARKRIGNEYDEVERAITVRADNQLVSDLKRIADDADLVLTAPEYDKFVRPVKNALAKFGNVGEMAGEAYQGIKNKGSPLKVLAESSNSDIAHYADMVLKALKANMIRSAPPDMAKRYAQADKHYAVLETVTPIVGKAPTGDISPALLRGAVGAEEIARGRGYNLGELAQIGQRFLKEQRSSGTSERQWWQNTLGQIGMGFGGAAGGTYAYHNPDQALVGAGGVAAMLAAGRGAGAILRSDRVANRMIQSGLGQQQAPGAVNRLLSAPYMPGIPASAAIVQQRMPERAPR